MIFNVISLMFIIGGFDGHCPRRAKVAPFM